MALAIAQHKVGTVQASPTSVSESFDSTPATSSLIVVIVHLRHGSVGPPAVTLSDNQGNTYTSKSDTTQSRVREIHAFKNNPTSSGTYTVTATPESTPAALWLQLYEITGHDTTPDEAVNSSGDNSTTPTTGNVTPAGTALYIATTTLQTTGGIITEESGWTNVNESDTSTLRASCLDKISTGTDQGDWTATSSNNWRATITAWKEAAAAGGQPAARRIGRSPIGLEGVQVY